MSRFSTTYNRDYGRAAAGFHSHREGMDFSDDSSLSVLNKPLWREYRSVHNYPGFYSQRESRVRSRSYSPVRQRVNQPIWKDPYTIGHADERKRQSRSHSIEGRDEKNYDINSEDLRIISIDVLATENAVYHHTYKFDSVGKGRLVVRRGQSFDIHLILNREFRSGIDSFQFVFQTGTDPHEDCGTFSKCLLDSGSNTSGFKATLKQRYSKDEMIISLYTPSDCIVSNWKMVVETVQLGNDRAIPISTSHAITLIILFNSWCIDDTVYYHDQILLEEYINNDSGVIFHGNYKQIGGKPWFFGQFEDGILEACLYCMQKGFHFKIDQNMADPVRVSKAISKIVNAQDDRGIVVGNWTGNYSNGVSPLKWSGSVAILTEYMETNRPVRFGQCFVYAGVMTTICRAIGLPCRCVTVFRCNHDTDGNTAINAYFDLVKEEMLETQSLWSFHVLNEVWMLREELPLHFSGWQVVDSTPQNRTNGIVQCGPVSLKGIKEGFTDHGPNVPILFAKVNGDRVTWGKHNDGRRFVISVDQNVVGQIISTKVPDGKPIPADLTNVEGIREDITHTYKYEAGPAKEKVSIRAAKFLGLRHESYYDNGRQDVKFDGFEDTDNVLIGSDFTISGYLSNLSKWNLSVVARLVCEAVTYTGRRLDLIRKQTFGGTLLPRNSTGITLNIRYDEYIYKLDEQGCMKLTLILRVVETGQMLIYQDDFRLRRPDLIVEIQKRVCTVNNPVNCRVSFTNPLPDTPLRNCTITLEGTGLEESERHQKLTDVPPYSRWSTMLTLTPTKTGKRQVFVTFNSDLIEDISGAAVLNVE